MYRELNISESEGVLAAFNAVCELKEETERLQAACAAKEAELAGLRAQTAELFAERVAAEGMDADAVTAAKAMWQSDPESAARAVLGCDIAEAANPYGCNQYGHGFREPHGAAGGRGQKTFGFFAETQKEVNKDRRKAQRAFESAARETEKALSRVKETADAVERYANSPDDKTKSMDDLISEADKLKEANKQAIKVAKAARRKQLQAAREAGKKVKYEYSNEKTGHIDNDLYDEFKDVFDDDDVKSSRTLEEMLDADVLNAANPYGCNQYGHEWKGKHGEGWKPSGRGGESGNSVEKQEESPEEANKKASELFVKSQEASVRARAKVHELSQQEAVAKINGNSERAKKTSQSNYSQKNKKIGDT